MATSEPDRVVEELTRPVVKLLLALIGLFVLRFIVVRLPGLETQIPGGTAITFATLAAAVITLVMIAIIVNFGRELEPRLNRVLSGPAEVVSDMSEAVKQIVFLVAIFIAYDGMTGVALPFLIPDPGPWVYDIFFLLVALVPTVIIAQRIFGNIDEITDILTQQVKSVTVDKTTCPSCSASVRASLDFCPECGETLPDQKKAVEHDEDSSVSICPECSADVEETAAFCGSCGTEIATGGQTTANEGQTTANPNPD
ncbi:double zinc ribbon domain-containing protein [Halovalidus salilacus]|uniref:double zinc ribbon domain-containing protein n=1 Tax=Halovalidus salilacus TaxID=3075124 RepID=UPI003622E23B